ncbi:sensor histidine kinase [Alkalitalea saponilacus]|uniref:Histidine kinase n=1 Tax=Alkalitalea saponilacus TaxID=889453 RepID=A0A1T5FNJ6_9BACT|nr:histidine kinase [Alkalitalea saponilacus]ASB49450.1 histidine kinase [Alkalitalea saponilacus]SKB97705.1 Histidine kinase [Alkalitalea saponilacus]
MSKHTFKPGVQPRYIDFRRIVIELIASVFISWLILTLVGDESAKLNVETFKAFAFVVVTLICLCEGIFIFDALISKRYPWHTSVRKRVVALFTFSVVWLNVVGFMAGNMSRLIFEEHAGHKPGDDHYVAVTILILFTIIYVISLIGYNYHETLKKFIVDNERLQREKLELDYFALQDQLNPHFLFNNMSTLMAIIPDDCEKALSFAGNFTDVYRYVLMSSRHKLVTLQDELMFIQSYVAIHQERLGSGLLVTYDVSEDAMKRKVPTLSLQFLVENAIKHNVATKEEPLLIRIGIEKNMLKVTNNLQPKLSTYSTNTGLRNLKRRIQFLAEEKDLVIESDEKFFTVKVPVFE